MSQVLYESKDSVYYKNNPTWHVEDSPWKANLIVKMLKRNSVNPQSVAEVGCGAGEIINQLHKQLDDNIQFYGFEISPDAFELAKERIKARISISNKDIFEANKKYSVLLIIDVFEHVDNYLEFIRKTKSVAEYKIFHIPLDMTVLNVFRETPIITARKLVGHLHYFSKQTAIASLQDGGHEIIDFFYTPGMLELGSPGLKTKLLNPIRKLLFAINPNFAVRLLGGHSLLVLTK